ncbi:MAG: hypothetical protein OEQ53_20620 [Saprospiraceae bacterium]|nr:hypothetical protein [Saprospiraceae bacterium]
MNQQNRRNIGRLILLVLLQVLIFKQLTIGWTQFNYIQVIIYPLFLMLLPINIGKGWLLVIAFALGLIIDMFYDSPGVHASACLFTGLLRPFILQVMEPRGGYKVNAIPTRAEFGNEWFFRYAALLLVVHILAYFSVEVFNLGEIGYILLKTIFTFLPSMLLIVIYMYILNPRY